MSSSSDLAARSAVLRGTATAARPAFLDTELGRVDSLVAPTVADDAVVDCSDEARAAGYATGYVEGHREGMAIGYADGHRAGQTEAAAAEVDAARVREVSVRSALDALLAAAAACNERQAVAWSDIEHQVVDLVFELTEALLGRELAHVSTPGRDALARALALMGDRGNVVARLHPDDVEALDDVADLVPGRTITIVADPGIERAGCVVEAGAMRVDAQLGPALDRAKRALRS